MKILKTRNEGKDRKCQEELGKVASTVSKPSLEQVYEKRELEAPNMAKKLCSVYMLYIYIFSKK